MTRNDLMILAEKARLLNKMCGERDVLKAFNIGKESMVDELDSLGTL